MEYRVLALDPGGTTGWALYSADKIQNPTDGFEFLGEKWQQGQIGPEEHHKELWILLGNNQVQEYIVVCESFEFRNTDRKHRDNINLMSREYIGVAKLFRQSRMDPYPGRQLLVMQTAGYGKGLVTDDKIRKAGLWQPSQKHAMDATRHLLAFLVNKENRMDLVRRWWR